MRQGGQVMQGATDYVGEARRLAADAAMGTSKCTAVYVACTLDGANEVAAELRRLGMEVEGPVHCPTGGWQLQGRWPLHHACADSSQLEYHQLQAEAKAGKAQCAAHRVPCYNGGCEDCPASTSLDEAGVREYAARMDALHDLAKGDDLMDVLNYAEGWALQNGHSRMLTLAANARRKVLRCRG